MFNRLFNITNIFKFGKLNVAFILVCFLASYSSFAQQECPELDVNGVFDPNDDVLMTSYHQSIAKTPGGVAVWGEAMAANGGNQSVITELTPANGYNYTGDIIQFALSGNTEAQSFLATTGDGVTGVLYAWGDGQEVVGSAFVTGNSFAPMVNVPFNPIDVHDLHASSDVLFVTLTNGNVWVATNAVTAPNGTTSTNANIWHQVETAASTPLTNAVQVTGNKVAGYALRSDGTIYAWGNNVELGNGGGTQNLSFATQMTAIPGGVTPTYISSIYDNGTASGLLALGDDEKLYGVGDNTNGEIITTGTGNVATWTAIKGNDGVTDLTDVIYMATSHTSEEWSTAGVLVRGATANDPNVLFLWGQSNLNSIADLPSGLQANPTTPPSFTAGVDNPGNISVGGHASTYFNKASGSICFAGHVIDGSTGGLTTGDGASYECVIPIDITLCGIKNVDAKDDLGVELEQGVGGVAVANVLVNDNYDGGQADFTNVTITQLSTTNPGVTLNTSTGAVNVSTSVPSGTYKLVYQMCEIGGAPTNCDNATVTVVVGKDTDGDLIPDEIDIDDDNDGILDTDECDVFNNPAGVIPNAGGTITFNSDVDVQERILTNNNDGAEFNTTASALVVSFGQSLPVGTTVIVELDRDSGTDFATFRIEQTNNANGTGATNPLLINNSSGLSTTFQEFSYVITGTSATHLRISLDDIEAGGEAEVDHVRWNAFSGCSRDTDGDGIEDSLDIDSDNDGILDNIEGQVQGNFVAPTGSVGANGLYDIYETDDTVNATSYTIANTDNDGTLPDYIDIDADNDGIPDNVEAQVTVGYNPPTGNVGANGLDSTYENFDTFTATGLFPVDTENDGTPDYRDLNSDNDAFTDIEENNEGNTPGTGDTDGDGLLNNFDDVTGPDVNDDINDPVTDLPDGDGDVNSGGDVDYRDGVDGLDTDDDGIPDDVDIDDDDDGILDINECTPGTFAAGTIVNDENTTITLDQGVGRQERILTENDNGAEFNSTTDVLVISFSNTLPVGTTVIVRAWNQDPVDEPNNTLRIEQANTANGSDASNPLDLSSLTDTFTDYQYVITGTSATHLRLSMPVDEGGRIEVDFVRWEESSFCTDFDTDGDGIVDRLDIDSDNDGIVDNYEAQVSGSYVAPTGLDDDDDGLDNAYDADDNNIDPTISAGISPENTDSDGIPDYLDIDADDDGIPDNIEAQSTIGYVAPSGTVGVNGLDDAYDFLDNFLSTGLGSTTVNTDTDINNNPDNLPDYRDTDSDGDGTLDADEGLTSINGGTFGTDTDGDGLDDIYEGASNNDPLDVNDDINDPTAGGLIDADNDVNGVGDVDYRDILTGTDTDDDGIIDSIDIDDDNDGIIDSLEDANLDMDDDPLTNPTDFDGDGIPNHLDMDSDGDGILDNVEAQTAAGFVAPPTTGIAAAVGANGLFSIYENNDTPSATGLTPNVTSAVDTTPDYLDIDADDDGIPDNVEFQTTIGYNPPTGNVGLNGVDSAYENNDSFTAIGGTPVNTDTVLNNNADTIPDYRDTDADGDGILDQNESGITDQGGGTSDTDSDGLLDRWEGSNNNDGNDVNDEIDDPVNDLEDVDGDGNSTGDVDYRDINITIDTDKDGVPDNIDIDDDNDGLLDINEGSGANNPIGDEDGDGLLNFEDNSDGGNGGDGSTTDYTDTNADGIPDVFDTDNDGIPNHLDIDADNDGIPDNVEIQPTLGYIAPSGVGNGITDADGDGLDDNYDSNTSNTTAAASIGIETPENTDGTDNPDYLDLDSDNDTKADITENGNANSVSGTDTDGDGLDDAFEGISNTDNFDVNDEIHTPSTDLPDGDGDVNDVGGNVDYRDTTDDPPGPPAVAGNILWLRADLQASPTLWEDQSGSDHDATGNGNNPVLDNDGINFNPSFDFNGTNDLLTITNGIFETASYPEITSFVVTKTDDENNNSFTFQEEFSGAPYFSISTPFGNGDVRYGVRNASVDASVTFDSAEDVWDIYNFYGDANTVNTPDNSRQAIYRNGNRIGTETLFATQTGNNSDFTIGVGDDGGNQFYDGEIAEIVVFSNVQTPIEQQKWLSYLALKYGITLGTTNTIASIIEGNYVASDETTVYWNFPQNSGFHNDVAGIGRDDGFALNQKQSKSVNAGSVVTIGRNSIVDTNAGNSSSIPNNSYLVWGHNGVDVSPLTNSSTTLVCETELQLGRVWKIVETGTVGRVEIAAPVTTINTALNNTNQTRVLKIADDAALTTNIKYVQLSTRTVNGVSQYVADFDFTGTKYFTYAQVLGIFWNGDTATWTGGLGANGAPSVDGTDPTFSDGLKVMVIDAETSGTNAFMTESANVQCLWVRENSKLIIGNDLFLEFNEDFILDGEVRLIGDAQLVQTHPGPSNVQGNGKLYRDQAALVPSIYRYHYWSSPVTAALGNTTFRVMDVMKDGTTPTSENSIPKNINFIQGSFNSGISTNLNGAPTDPITISDFWIYTYLNGTVRDDWVQKREDGVIPVVEGYIMKSTGRSPQNFTFVGSPNDGSYSKTLTAGTTSLLGNPYPSVLNTAAFIADNIDVIDGTLYYWEHQGEASTTTVVEGHFEFGYIGGYSQRNQAMGVAANSVVVETAGLGDGTYTAPPQFVSVAQSFFVSVPGNKGGTVNFENSHRAASLDNTFLRNSGETLEDIPNLKIGMDYITDTNAEIHRQLGVNFKEGNTFEYDAGYDSGIFDLQPTDMFWDFKELETNLVIAGVDKLSADLQVPIGFNIDSDFPVKVMLDETNNIDKSVDIYLVDLVTGRFYNLENPVQLDLPKGNYTDRFILTFSGEALSTNNPLLKGLNAFVNNGSKEIVIRNNDNNTIKSVEVFNIVGQKINQWRNIENTYENTFDINHLSSGIYIIRIQTENGFKTQKVVVE